MTAILGFPDADVQAQVLPTCNLSSLQQAVREVNEANGWFEGDRTMAEDIVLIATELGELGECLRDSENPAPQHWYSGDKHKPEGIMSELADIIIRCLDMAERHEDGAGITLNDAVAEKLVYNASRGHRHGGKAL